MADERKDRWYPNLSSRIDPITDQAIRYLFDAIYALQDGSGLGDGAKKVITETVGPSLTLPAITAHVSQALSAGGSSPLNVTGLPGVLPQPQPTATPVVTALPTSGPLVYIGSQVLFNGLPYTYTANPTAGGPAFWKLQVATAAPIYDTHANRTNYPAANYPLGTTYFEIDRTNVTYVVQNVSGVNTWLFYNGIMVDVLANLPTLGVNDANFQFQASDFAHVWTWDGAAWHFAPGNSSGYYTFTNTGSPPVGGVWGKADGSTYTQSIDNATTISVVSANISGNYIRL